MSKECEGLSLYEPLQHQEPFFACDAPERIGRGSNRGGKTILAAVEVARAVTGQDPYDKYPRKNGRCFIVGKNGKHNSEVLYRKLFVWGAFQIITDKETGKWRAFKPWMPEDAARSKEARLAPPLIPPRMVKEISWENKKERVPNVVQLKNGWDIRFFSSLGMPPQGSDIDLCWFDEEIMVEAWYPEIAARLIDRRGKFIWSATAQMGGYQLYELCMSAEKEHSEGVEPRRVVEFRLHINDNPYITQEMKDLFFSKLNEEQRRIRIDSEFAFVAFKVYPEFNLTTHCIDSFEVPDDWTRYMAVDPGRQVCGVLFAACPPKDHELTGHVVLYEELYIRNCDNQKFAKAIKEKVGRHRFRDFLIDHQGARVRTMSDAGTQEEQLMDVLREHNIKSRLSKHGFTWGSPKVPDGVQAVRDWLVKGRGGKPILLVMRERLPNFIWEIERYSYKRENGMMTDKVEKRHDHLMDCLRYLAGYQPQWHRSRKVSKAIWNIVQKKKQKELRKHGRAGVNLGPVS